MSLTGISVAFKEVFTNDVRWYPLKPSWSVRQMVETLRPHLARDFNTNEFDIVETGQDLPGIPAEAGQPLELSNITLKNKWGKDLRISFYIRRRNYSYFELQNLNLPRQIDTESNDIEMTTINPIITNSITVTECPICLENVPTFTRYRCAHGVCNDCYYRWQYASETNIGNVPTCAYCRST